MAAAAEDAYKSAGGVHASGMNGLLGHWLRLKGPSGFGSGSTAEQVARKWDGNGKVVVITGASTGLGLEATRVMAQRGAEVIMGVRDMEKGKRNADKIRAQNPDAKLTLLPLDLASLTSVKAFAEEFKKLGKPLHILMLNAGIMATRFHLSADGYEGQWATNHLGHFLLTQLLLDPLRATAKQQQQQAGAGGARIVVLSSLAHFTAYPEGLRVVGLQTPLGYDAWQAYGQSKLCNVLFTRALNERVQGQGVTAVCCHPGGINTELARDMAIPVALRKLAFLLFTPFLKSVPQGAATQMYCATSPDVVGGEYYADSNLQPSSQLAHSRVLGEKLWQISDEICRTKGFLK